jgi:TonB-dependent receptor
MQRLVLTILVLSPLLCSSTLLAQGILQGVVKDSLEHQALIGAHVHVTGTAFGAATDKDGKYSIHGIPAGTYAVCVSYIGYKPKSVHVAIEDKVTSSMNANLVVDAIEGETVTITAQAMGQAAAINQQLTSNTITNVVASDKILELPDANAAESVGRLPGVSIQRSGGEGNKVVIRGLSPTYNAITIAGDRIPATDLDDRSVDLSMIAPEILAGIEVMKAITPDKDADAFGGTVDFQLATAPLGGFAMNTRIQSGYNKQRLELGEYKGRVTMSNRYFDERLGILMTGNFERTQRGSDQFGATYAVAREMRPGEEFAPITTLSAQFDHTTDVRRRLGFSVMLDYELGTGRIVQNNFVSRLDRNEFIRTRRFDMSGSNKMKYYLREREREIDILTNALGGDHDLSFMKVNWRVSRTSSMTRYPFNSRFQFEEANAFNTSNIPSIASPDQLIENAYNRWTTAYLYDGEVEPERSMERDLSAQFNVTIPYTVSAELVGTAKAGIKYRDKLRERDRDYATKRLDITDSNFERFHSRYGTPGFSYVRMSGTGYAGMTNYVDPGFDPGKFLDGQYDFGPGLDATELRHFLDSYLFDKVYRFSLQRDLDDYEVKDRLTAGYVMTEINLGRVLMVLPGVRYERTTIDATGRIGIVNTPEEEGLLEDERVRDTTSVIQYERWFPMVHLRIRPADWLDLRLAYTTSVSYPRMDYIIPSKRIKASSLLVEFGNSMLTPQYSTNYDAYLSLYGNRLGLFTLGAFYKDIDHLVYLRSGHVILDPAKEGVDPVYVGYTISRPENNPNRTIVKGLECEWQTSFKWLPAPLDGLVLNANYTHIWSSTHFPRSFVLEERLPVFPFRKTTVVDSSRAGSMPDQANDIANISLGYDLGRFSGRLSMVLQGKTLTFVGVREELDGFTDTFTRWDLSLKYDVTNVFSIFCNLNNFTNSPDASYMQTARYATGKEYYGWTTDLGVNIKL